MNIPGYDDLHEFQQEILHALLEREGVPNAAAALSAGEASALLGLDFRGILCAVKTAAAVACGAVASPSASLRRSPRGASCVAGCNGSRRDKNLQMVIRSCVTSASIVALLEPPPGPTTAAGAR